MNKVVASFLGRDCPGVTHNVAKLLHSLKCSVNEITQTILQGEYAMIVIATPPKGLELAELEKQIAKGLKPHNMSFTLREFSHEGKWDGGKVQPFVVTLQGPDSEGLIARMSGVLSKFNANIENLKAFACDTNPDHIVVGFEIVVGEQVDLAAFRTALGEEAEALGSEVSLQHRDIFEAMHRVQPL